MKRALKRVFWLIIVSAVAAFAVHQYIRREPITTVRISSQWFASSDKPLIVFVHGLGGDPYETWGKENGSFMELIQKEKAFNDFNVVSVAYPTSLFSRDVSLAQLTKSFANWLDDNFKFKGEIVIIAHSLGGVIARQGLVLSKFKNRGDQTATLITLASPFDGSQLPDFAKILDLLKMSSRQLAALRIRSDILEAFENDWLDFIENHGSRVRQFAASEGKSIRGIVVVTDASATQNIPPDCIFRSTSDDHLSIAKPASLDVGIGKQVRDWILNRRYSSGDHVIGYDLLIPPSGSLTIEPGANIILKNARLIVKGKIVANGTEAGRIRFEYDATPTNEAGIVLRGDTVAKSRFAYCTFQKGHGVGLRKPGPDTFKKMKREDAWGDKTTALTEAGRRVGGAITLIGTSDVTFSNCEFMDNEAYQGGAIALFGCTRIRMEHCRFEGNMSGFGGGAIFAQASDFEIGPDCRFDQNITGQMVASFKADSTSQNACGGGIYLGYLARCTIEHSVFERNKASHAGGAIYIRDTHPLGFEATPKSELNEIVFSANESSHDGAALCIEAKSQGIVVNPLFEDNIVGSNLENPGCSFLDQSEVKFVVTNPVWRRKGEPYVEECTPH